jgi:MFS family permease
MALNFLFVGPMMVGPAIMAKDRFAEGSIAFGVLLSAMGLGSLIGMLAAVVLKPSRLGLTTLSTIALAGLCIVFTGFAQSLWLAAALFAIGGASSGFSNLLLITWLQRYISKEMMGRMMSIVMLTSMGLMPISAALSGFIAEYNLTLLYVLNGSLLIVTVVLSLLNQKVRTMRA